VKPVAVVVEKVVLERAGIVTMCAAKWSRFPGCHALGPGEGRSAAGTPAGKSTGSNGGISRTAADTP
jgi:hypothetical protein